ncbi:phosphotriesterase [Rhodohalobacter sp. SW132]|nr:phosphotriesterase [Rhodohalobacter sp. SW132]
MLGNQHVSEDADQVQIMTVNGPVSASEMGTTLIHEHVLVDWIGADSTGYHRWDREEVVERVLPFFEEARERGVQTILECTPAYLGRDPYILQELSRRSGIQVLTNTGYYGAVENQFMPAHAREESAEDLAGRWITEYEEGIDGSGIRPGFMKISVKGEGPLSDLHQKIVRAAARTHLETGLTIVSHTTGDEPALAQVELLERAGISPSAFVWTHAQAGTLETQIEIGKKGGWISLDNFNYNPDDGGNLEWFLGRITELDKAGLLHRVLISHDAGYFNPDEPNGGDFRSYTDLFEHLLPALLENGFTDDDIDRLLVQNPQEAYGIQRR